MSRMASRAPIATSAPTAKIRIVCSFPGSRTPRRYEVPPRRASPESGHGRWNPRRKTATRRCPRRAEARGQGIRPSSRARATASVRLAAPSGAPLGSARLATPDHYPTILLRKTLGDMRGSIDLGYDDGDDRPGEGSAESSEIADDDFPALALNIPPGVSRNDICDTTFEDDEEVSDELPDPPRRATREDESASDIPGERADDTTEERDTILEGDGRASSGLSRLLPCCRRGERPAHVKDAGHHAGGTRPDRKGNPAGHRCARDQHHGSLIAGSGPAASPAHPRTAWLDHDGPQPVIDGTPY